jgi:carbamoyltransferase
MGPRILGICTEPDGFSAAVVIENVVVSAVEQVKIRETWSPRENAVLPKDAILASLQAAQVDLSAIDIVAITANSQAVEQLLPHIRNLGINPKSQLTPVEVHTAHCTAAFYGSPFDRAATLILGNAHSDLAAVHARISRILGFNARTSSKVAWLGTAGEPEFLDIFREIQSAGTEATPLERLLKTIDCGRRQNVAASLQAFTNQYVIEMAEQQLRDENTPNLCVAGQLAENPLLVRELEQHFGADHVYVPPAPGNEILSIGAALAVTPAARIADPQARFIYPALGAEFSDAQIKSELDNCKLAFSFLPGNEAVIENVSTALAAGSLVGWFQGRCEFGHRALGFRSILANPFTPYVDENINRFLKHRESFHPFVISVPEESAPEYFHRVGCNARTISSVYVVNDSRRDLLAKFTVQNVYVRVHTVNARHNPLYWTLLRQMQSVTGHPLLINTSFNLPGEPLVLTPRDAIRTFYSSGLDALMMGRFLITK